MRSPLYRSCVLVMAFWSFLWHTLLAQSEVKIEDIYVPETCENIAEVGDHLLVEFELKHDNGTVGAWLAAPKPWFHIHLINTELPIIKGLKGICKNGTRMFRWTSGMGVDFSPIFQSSLYATTDDALSLRIKVVHLTPQRDFQIFASLRTGNLSEVMDMIDEHRGINAMDEWGQSPLMLALSKPRELLSVVAFLMNTRRPMVDVNLAKASGFTALFYAVEHNLPVEILKALLRRGGDPNVAATSEGSIGNTPLHYACFLEKLKHAEALLEYWANPFATNQHGQNPFQLIPATMLKSSKLAFQKIFQAAESRLSHQIGSSTNQKTSDEL